MMFLGNAFTTGGVCYLHLVVGLRNYSTKMRYVRVRTKNDRGLFFQKESYFFSFQILRVGPKNQKKCRRFKKIT